MLDEWKKEFLYMPFTTQNRQLLLLLLLPITAVAAAA
jgi:hypothetical protein